MQVQVSRTSEVATSAGARERRSPEILILSSSLFMDRVLMFGSLLRSIERRASARLWVTTATSDRCSGLWRQLAATVEPFPRVRPFKQFPYNYLRRLNDFVWDHRQPTPSRESMWRHVRSRSYRRDVRALRAPARLVACLGAEAVFEDLVERVLLSYPRSDEAEARLRERPPDVLLTTGPFQFEQPAVTAAAKRLGIPTLAMIPSWDNLSTKNRLVFKYDGFVVWSERTREELHDLYPQTRTAPVYVVGAPQFDLFFDERFRVGRREFCASQGLRPELPVVVYAIGSPNFIAGEHHGALALAERIERGELGDVQLLVRPHPLHDDGGLTSLFERFGPRVVVQRTPEPDAHTTARTQNEMQIVEWVNTFRHADVVVNLSSTVTVDAAIFDRPVVNLDFDPEPGGPNDALVRDVNHSWSHFAPIASSGGVWLVRSHDELAGAVRGYLESPDLHRDGRRWIVEHVCQFADGHCGERMAAALVDFAATCRGRAAR